MHLDDKKTEGKMFANSLLPQCSFPPHYTHPIFHHLINVATVFHKMTRPKSHQHTRCKGFSPHVVCAFGFLSSMSFFVGIRELVSHYQQSSLNYGTVDVCLDSHWHTLTRHQHGVLTRLTLGLV